MFTKDSAPEFELDADQCLELLLLLYGLGDAGDLWHVTLDRHLRDELGLSPTKADPALYIMRKNEWVVC